MKKINFTCPHCGGHKLICEQPLQWIQMDIIGLEDGELILDHDMPSIVVDDGDDFEIYCKNCYAEVLPESIEKMLNSND